MVKKDTRLFSGLLVGLLLVGFASASAQMSRGTIENMLLEDENKNCEFVSMQDGIDTPMRFAMTFPSTPNVRPEIHGTDPLTEFSSDFNNNGFFFSTNATDLFTIKLNVSYDVPSSTPRMFFYELFTGGGMINQVGNWELRGNSFCKIIELNAKPAPHVLSDEEIVATIAGYEKEQHEITHGKQDETNNMIAVIVIAVVTVSIIGVIVLIFMKLSKSRDVANANLVTKQFAKTIERFDHITKYFTSSINYQDTKIESIRKSVEQGLRDIMIAVFNHMDEEKKLAFPKPPTAYTKSADDNISSGMSMFDLAKSRIQKMANPKAVTPEQEKRVTSAMRLFDIGKSFIGIPKDTPSMYDKFTDEQLYKELDDMYRHIADYHVDPVFKEKYDTLNKMIKERIEKR